jgi:hypothetical protein
VSSTAVDASALVVANHGRHSAVSTSTAGAGPNPSSFTFGLFSQKAASPARPPLAYQHTLVTASTAVSSPISNAARQPDAPFLVPKPTSQTLAFSPPVLASQLRPTSERISPSLSYRVSSDTTSQAHRLCYLDNAAVRPSLIAPTSRSLQEDDITTDYVASPVEASASSTRCALSIAEAPTAEFPHHVSTTPLHRISLQSDVAPSNADPSSSARASAGSRRALLDVTNNPTHASPPVFPKHSSVAVGAVGRSRKSDHARSESLVVTDRDLGSSSNPIAIDFD